MEIKVRVFSGEDDCILSVMAHIMVSIDQVIIELGTIYLFYRLASAFHDFDLFYLTNLLILSSLGQKAMPRH